MHIPLTVTSTTRDINQDLTLFISEEVKHYDDFKQVANLTVIVELAAKILVIKLKTIYLIT